MNSEDDSESTVAHQEAKNLVRSQFYDVMVKVDTDVYCLDKLQLAWKSCYFERLLIEYSDQGECNLIELPLMDTETFSSVVDVIYGQPLASILNNENFITLLIAMDYLQMEIDLETYGHFLQSNSVLDVKVFKLYDFVQENPNLRCLLPHVLIYLSKHLAGLRSREEFLSLPLDDIIQIIVSRGMSPNEKVMREICQICAEWIHYDLENRLTHATKLVNAAKRRFVYANGIKDVDFNAKLAHVAEHMKLEQIAKLFHKFLVFNGDINTAGQELLKLRAKKNETTIGVEKNERKKLEKLLENGYFYDIAVKVEEKIYKLHRFKLNSASGYFADIFSAESFNTDTQCAEVTTQRPIKDNEYLLRDVDQTTFEMIIEYIYFGKLQLTCETITRVLKAAAANNLRIEKLFDKCISWIKENIEEICSKVLIIDECICRSWIEENVEEICSEVLIKPEMINTFPICSISFDMLENLLLSSPVCCDNPQKIVEICAKWVMHDVKNRYHLIPQIAVDINHNRMVEYDDYKIEEIADLHNLTEQHIRVKLWNTLSSTSLVPPATNNISRKGRGSFSKILPVFVASTGDMTVRILNVDLNEIASFSFFSIISTNEPKDIELRNTYFKVSATSIRDNLFVMFTPDYYSRLFYVYNSTSKELRSLNCFRKKVASILCKYSLLNCRDQVYCCFENGQVFKYLVEMNRWMIFSKAPASVGGNGKRVWFTSHGNELYRMYKNEETRSTYVIEEFNFQQNVWLSLPHSSFTPATQSSYDTPIGLISINAGDILAVIFPSYLRLFDLSTRSWREISLAGDVGPTSSNRKPVFALVQCQGELLRVFCDKIYYWSGRNGRWVLKKELPEKSHLPDGVLDRPTSFKHITAVHGWGHHQKRVNL
ncbi:uncharacterized protein LOC135837017 [Planococcus citri]|uniref:uncharacterized protein LOC135837017 n=1 Tax=Planococcus citri TaxID=170843 RepID=UPI0031F9C3F6